MLLSYSSFCLQKEKKNQILVCLKKKKSLKLLLLIHTTGNSEAGLVFKTSSEPLKPRAVSGV